MLNNGANLAIHDPRVSQTQVECALGKSQVDLDNFNESIWIYEKDIIKAVKSADAIIILTEWDEYKNLNWESLIKEMRKPAWVFDTRAVINPKSFNFEDVSFWNLGIG